MTLKCPKCLVVEESSHAAFCGQCGQSLQRPVLRSPFVAFGFIVLGCVGLTVAGMAIRDALRVPPQHPIPVAPSTPLVVSSTPAGAMAQSVDSPANVVWDFTDGGIQGTRGQNIEIVDAGKLWNLPGGSHMRFKVPGESWMEAEFLHSESDDSQGGNEAIWTLGILHLESSPDGVQPGNSPVRITVNGQSVWNGSPSGEPGRGPGNLWSEQFVDISDQMKPGQNVLRWDYLPDASSHYWLKQFQVTRSTR